MSNQTLDRIIYACSMLILLTALGFGGDLNWRECMRLFLVSIGLTVLYFKFRTGLQTEIEMPDPSLPRSGSIVVALVLAFVLTQFDIATSAGVFHEQKSRLNPFFLVTSVLAGLMGLAFIRSQWRTFSWKRLRILDRIVLGTVPSIIVVLLLSARVLVGHISKEDVLASIKILSFLFVWFPVTWSFGRLDWAIDSGPNSGFPKVLLDRWRGILIGFLLLAVFSLVSGAYKCGAVISEYGTAQKLFEAGDLEAAKIHYESLKTINRIVDLKYIRDRSLGDLAAIYLKQGDENSARKAMGELKGAIYDQAAANRMVGDTYSGARMWSRAVPAYLAYLEQVGKDLEILNKLGRAYLQLRDSRGLLQLVDNYNQMPELETTSYEEKIFLGNVLLYREDFSAALELFKTAGTMRPRDAYSAYKIGRVYLAKEKHQKAISAFETAIQREPNFADAYYRIGVCYERQGRSQDAVEMYRQTVEFLPNHLDGLLALKRLSEELTDL